MGNFTTRIDRLEKVFKNYVYENNECHGFVCKKDKLTDEEIIFGLEIHGIKVTKKEFVKWKKVIHGNEMFILSPHWSIDKYLRQRIKQKRNKGEQ